MFICIYITQQRSGQRRQQYSISWLTEIWTSHPWFVLLCFLQHNRPAAQTHGQRYKVLACTLSTRYLTTLFCMKNTRQVRKVNNIRFQQWLRRYEPLFPALPVRRHPDISRSRHHQHGPYGERQFRLSPSVHLSFVREFFSRNTCNFQVIFHQELWRTMTLKSSVCPHFNGSAILHWKAKRSFLAVFPRVINEYRETSSESG